MYSEVLAEEPVRSVSEQDNSGSCMNDYRNESFQAERALGHKFNSPSKKKKKEKKKAHKNKTIVWVRDKEI